MAMNRFLLTIMIPLCCACGSSRKTEKISTANMNMFATETLKAQTVAIPARKAKLSIPLINGAIAGLPPGASYQARNAHTSVTARVENDTLVIVSETDSIMSTVYDYEKLIKENTDTTIKEEKEKSIGNSASFQLLILAISVFFILLFVYRKQ